jgi:hypothetical protein
MISSYDFTHDELSSAVPEDTEAVPASGATLTDLTELDSMSPTLHPLPTLLLMLLAIVPVEVTLVGIGKE